MLAIIIVYITGNTIDLRTSHTNPPTQRQLTSADSFSSALFFALFLALFLALFFAHFLALSFLHSFLQTPLCALPVRWLSDGFDRNACHVNARQGQICPPPACTAYARRGGRKLREPALHSLTREGNVPACAQGDRGHCQGAAGRAPKVPACAAGVVHPAHVSQFSRVCD